MIDPYTAEMREPWHRDLIIGMLADTRRPLSEWAESVAKFYSCAGSLEVTAVIWALLAEVERLRADLDFARSEAKSIYDTCKQIERERDTAHEVALGNKRHVAILATVLLRIEQLTNSTDGDDLDDEVEIPVGEIRRALNEPVEAAR